MADEGGDAAAPGGTKRAFSLDAARNATLLLAIYLYFAGFVYRDFYAHTFGIPSATDTPAYTYLVYAYNALAPAIGWFALVLLALLAYDTYAAALARKPSPGKRDALLVDAEPAVFAITAVLLFPVIFVCAQRSAVADATAIRCGEVGAGTQVVVHFKAGKALGYDPDFVAAIPQGYAYLLARTDEALYVLYQPAGAQPAPRGGTSRPPAGSTASCGFLSAARIYQIPKDDVEHVMTLAPTVYR